MADRLDSGEAVVREAGWVFNGESGDDVTLEQFVATGDDEAPAYLAAFGLDEGPLDQQVLVEIGAGIGRMTSAFTRLFGSVIACDLDPGFLERCREVVSLFGRVDRLTTSVVADGHTLDLADDVGDVAFSYITLQHCSPEDALDLSQEAVRVTKPGGKVVLNYRGPTRGDAVLLPLGGIVRMLWRVPGLGSFIGGRRVLTRVGWQVARLHPDRVTAQLGDAITDVTVWTNSASRLASSDATIQHFDGLNNAHWWLVATVADGSASTAT